MTRTISDIDKILASYEAYLMLEKGLADNTRISYRADIDKLLQFVKEQGIQLRNVDLPLLQTFIAELHDLGIAATSQARIISGIKSFFKYLKMEDYIDENPSLLLEIRAQGGTCPKF